MKGMDKVEQARCEMYLYSSMETGHYQFGPNDINRMDRETIQEMVGITSENMSRLEENGRNADLLKKLVGIADIRGAEISMDVKAGIDAMWQQ